MYLFLTSFGEESEKEEQKNLWLSTHVLLAT